MAVLNSPSAGQSDVQNTINSAAPGDTILVPAGTPTWSGLLVIGKPVFLIGAGEAQTIITNTTTQLIYVGNLGSNPARISGFRFNSLDSSTIIISVNGTTRKLRVDHCFFNKGQTAVGWNYYPNAGPSYGLVDHCTLRNMETPVYPRDQRTTDGFAGSVSWSEWNADPLSYPGSDKMEVWEDNYFVWDSDMSIAISQGAVYGQRGGKLCFRHNTCDGYSPYMDGHGDGISSSVYGTILYEVYNNTFNEGHTHGASQGDIVWMRGGVLLAHNNTFTGTPSPPFRLSVYYENDIHRLNNTHFWGNTWNGSTNQASFVLVADSGQTSAGYSAANIRLNQEYFLAAPTTGQQWQNYTPLAYPHPLIAQTEGVTPVSNLRQSIWDVWAQTSSGRQALWNVLVAALISRDILWNVSEPDTIEAVSTSKSAAWNVAQVVLHGGLALWNARVQVTKGQQGRWNVEIAGTDVSGAQVRRVYVVYELFGQFNPPPGIPHLF
jgi:hypothetical protein